MYSILLMDCLRIGFSPIHKGVTDRENAQQLQAIRESLNALEGARGYWNLGLISIEETAHLKWMPLTR